MEKHKARGTPTPDFDILEERGGTRRDFLKAAALAASSLLPGGKSNAEQPAAARAAQGQSPVQKTFEGVYELEGGGELLLVKMPDGLIRGSRDGGRIMIEGRSGGVNLVYRWWAAGSGGEDYRQAAPGERGAGQAAFNAEGELEGTERKADGSVTRSIKAKKKPANDGILTVNQPFAGIWNGARSALAISQQPDGSLNGVHTPAYGMRSILAGRTADGKVEYTWWTPRSPRDTYKTTPAEMRGKGTITAEKDGTLRSEWTTDGKKKIAMTEVYRRNTPPQEQPAIPHAPIPDLNDMTLIPFIRSHPLAIIDFGATWCGPCKKIAPFFEQLPGRRPDVAFGRVDIDRARQASQAFRVNAVPTFVFFRMGQEVGRVVGAKPDEILQATSRL
ncbi:MAG: thioredoxin family protein [Candidatus Altiarchaeota archaeon]|nr:thioredoxin family protein [Candidatus Altiarchaeota archaeon]